MFFRVALTLIWSVATVATAQDEYHYLDRGGPPVLLPYGEMSFADAARFEPAGLRSGENRSDASRALGAPDHEFVSLGCGGGHLIVQFTDNELTNIFGPDIYVFETGPAREPTDVAISTNGTDWIPIDRAEGATVGIDISGNTGTYRYVRLTNASTRSCRDNTPGADIDAVAAIGAGRVERLFQSSVLFDNNQTQLRADALPALDALATELQRLNPARAFVVGHTDDVGSEAYNLDLSARRAATVQANLSARQPNAEIRSSAFGETQPVTSNETEAGRQSNRRVEVLIIPR